MNELVSTKEQLLSQIHNILISKLFTKDEHIYKRILEYQEPGVQMMFNGQVIHQPGTNHRVIFICELWGSGSIDDTPLEFIRFHIEDNDREVCELIHGFYHDDIQFFNTLATKIFQL